MKRYLSVVLLIIGLFVATSTPVWAAVTLTQVGGEAVTMPVTTVTTTTTNPEMRGTTEASALVTVSIDGKQSLVQANSSGTWQFIPTTLTAAGSYDISLSSGTDTLAFTLQITTGGTGTGTGTASAGVGGAGATESASKGGASPSASPTTLPESGANDVWWLMAGGLFFLVSGGLSYQVAKELQRTTSAHD